MSPRRKDEPSVMLVDDHPLWRDTLRKVVERSGVGRVVAEAADGGEAVELATQVRPDLLVMDMALPSMSGVEATRLIKDRLPDCRVLVISSFEARASVLEAVRAGASGYLLKTAGAKDVAAAMRRVAHGELVFPPKLADLVLEEFRRLADGSAGMPSRIALAGDSVVLREGLARILEEAGFSVVAQAVDVDGLLSILRTEPADVVVLDFHGEPDRGLKAAAAMRDARPDARVLVLAQDPEAGSALELLSDGAEGVGYLLRDRVADVADLVDAIRRVASGESVIDHAVVDGLVEGDRPSPKLSTLTPREREVLALMAEGHSNQGICSRLFLSSKTLEKHVRAIFTKLGIEEAADSHRRVRAVLAYLRTV